LRLANSVPLVMLKSLRSPAPFLLAALTAMELESVRLEDI
jgi:hypothetical protein